MRGALPENESGCDLPHALNFQQSGRRACPGEEVHEKVDDGTLFSSRILRIRYSVLRSGMCMDAPLRSSHRKKLKILGIIFQNSLEKSRINAILPVWKLWKNSGSRGTGKRKELQEHLTLFFCRLGSSLPAVFFVRKRGGERRDFFPLRSQLSVLLIGRDYSKELFSIRRSRVAGDN